MTVQPDIPHKVRHTRHDLDDLYELMSRVEESQTLVVGVLEQHDNRFDEHDKRFDQHDKRFDELQQTLGLHGGRLDRIEDNQRRQFEHLSGQIAEILDALRGRAAADPAPESER